MAAIVSVQFILVYRLTTSAVTRLQDCEKTELERRRVSSQVSTRTVDDKVLKVCFKWKYTNREAGDVH